MKKETLERKVKPSKIKKWVGIAALSLAALCGSYAIYKNPTPTTIKSSTSHEVEPEENNGYKTDSCRENDNIKPETIKKNEYVSKYNYQIKDRFLEVYDKNSENTNNPDFKIDLPQEYSRMARKIYLLEKHLKNCTNQERERNIKALHENLVEIKKSFKLISPDDESLKSLDPEEKIFATKVINNNIISRLDKYIEEGKPEKDIKEDYYEKDIF